jgi:hypothetical protein
MPDQTTTNETYDPQTETAWEPPQPLTAIQWENRAAMPAYRPARQMRKADIGIRCDC